MAPNPLYPQAAKALIDETYYGGGWNMESGVPYTNSDYSKGINNANEVEVWQVASPAYTSGILNWYIATDPLDAEVTRRYSQYTVNSK